MKIEAYKQNKKVTEGEKEETLMLPLNIQEGKKHAEGGESEVWEIKTQNRNGIEELNIALKKSQRESFSTEEEMQNSKKFYEFLKQFPGFGKFVPDTLFFKAREIDLDEPKSFCIQKYTKGERIDRLKDDVIYKDPEVVRQLLELTEASIKLLQTVRREDIQNPDFMRTPELNSLPVLFGALIFNPRYSSNILLADKPDKNGQRIFFVDVGINANARMKKGWEWHGRKIVNSFTEIQFNEWKNKLEKILTKK